MRAFILFTLCIAAASASSLRIAGGTETTIESYPSLVSLLRTEDFLTYTQTYVGIILNQRSILTVAHPFHMAGVVRFRARVGSTVSNSGGSVHNFIQAIVNNGYDDWTRDNDIAILTVAQAIVFTPVVQAALIAGELYVVGDNQPVVAVGWGKTAADSTSNSEELRQVELLTVNQEACAAAYVNSEFNITENKLCAGWANGGRGQCVGDEGSPLFHNNVAIGFFSHGEECGSDTFPSVNTRINQFIVWIQFYA